MQVFVLLYIEGGSYIQEDEDAWEFFTLCAASPHPLMADLSDASAPPADIRTTLSGTRPCIRSGIIRTRSVCG